MGQPFEVKCPPDADAVLAMLGGEANATRGSQGQADALDISSLERFRVLHSFQGPKPTVGD